MLHRYKTQIINIFTIYCIFADCIPDLLHFLWIAFLIFYDFPGLYSEFIALFPDCIPDFL
jgi:hypothetical protein